MLRGLDVSKLCRWGLLVGTTDGGAFGQICSLSTARGGIEGQTDCRDSSLRTRTSSKGKRGSMKSWAARTATRAMARETECSESRGEGGGEGGCVASEEGVEVSCTTLGLDERGDWASAAEEGEESEGDDEEVEVEAGLLAARRLLTLSVTALMAG